MFRNISPAPSYTLPLVMLYLHRQVVVAGLVTAVVVVGGLVTDVVAGLVADVVSYHSHSLISCKLLISNQIFFTASLSSQADPAAPVSAWTVLGLLNVATAVVKGMIWSCTPPIYLSLNLRTLHWIWLTQMILTSDSRISIILIIPRGISVVILGISAVSNITHVTYYIGHISLTYFSFCIWSRSPQFPPWSSCPS